MNKTRVGFIVYGVHKDGLLDPLGTPFIDNKLIENAKSAFIEAWKNEYAVLGYGEHLYEDLIAFCELTDIKAIAL